MAEDLRSDVLVVGAGPAGGMAAYELARQGIGVLAVDRHRFPREKVCGDGLLEASVKILVEAGIWRRLRDRVHRVDSLRFFAPNGSEYQMQGDFATLRRRALDSKIVEEACSRGARFLDGIRVTGPLVESGTCVGAMAVDQKGRKARIGARLTLLATGANSRLLGAFGVLQQRRPSAIGIRGYFRLPDGADERSMIISYDRRLLPGYAWIFPVGEGIFNVGCGFLLGKWGKVPEAKHHLLGFHRDTPHYSLLLRGAKQVSSIRAAPIRTGFRGALACSPGLLVLGEALGLTFPFVGEGVGNALESGRLAARVAQDALAAGDVSTQFLSYYERKLRQLLGGYHQGYLAAERWFRHKLVANLVITGAASSQRLNDLVQQILRGQRDARAVFSLGGMLGVLLSRYGGM